MAKMSSPALLSGGLSNVPAGFITGEVVSERRSGVPLLIGAASSSSSPGFSGFFAGSAGLAASSPSCHGALIRGGAFGSRFSGFDAPTDASSAAALALASALAGAGDLSTGGGAGLSGN